MCCVSIKLTRPMLQNGKQAGDHSKRKQTRVSMALKRAREARGPVVLNERTSGSPRVAARPACPSYALRPRPRKLPKIVFCGAGLPGGLSLAAGPCPLSPAWSGLWGVPCSRVFCKVGWIAFVCSDFPPRQSRPSSLEPQEDVYIVRLLMNDF